MGLINKKIVTYNTRISESDEIKELQKLNDKINDAIKKYKKGKPISKELKDLLKQNKLSGLIGESITHYKKIVDNKPSRYKMINEGSRKNRIQMSEITDAVEEMEPFIANTARGVIERINKVDYYCVYAYRDILILKQELNNPRNYTIYDQHKKSNQTLEEIIKYVKIALGEWSEDDE